VRAVLKIRNNLRGEKESIGDKRSKGGDEREKQQKIGEDKLTDHHSKLQSQKSMA